MEFWKARERKFEEFAETILLYTLHINKVIKLNTEFSWIDKEMKNKRKNNNHIFSDVHTTNK